MLSDLLWLIILLFFVLPGIKYPYIALSGVMFVEILRPQSLSFGFLAGKPVFLVMVIVLFTSMLINFRELTVPSKKVPVVIFIIFMIWVTLATYNAQFQAAAWLKYDGVIKTMFVALLIPFILNTKNKIDTFVAIYVAAISFYTVSVGMKTMLGGAGYGHELVSSNGTALLSESSTMAMVAVFNIPLILYIKNNSVFSGQFKYLRQYSTLLVFSCIVTVIGTYARTGLIGLVVWVALVLKKSKNIIRNTIISFIVILVLSPLAPVSWLERMETINSSSEDSSAFGRIVVWKWTIDYVKEHPLMGGGFNSHLANAGELERYIETDIIISHTGEGKAFHSIYFEVLGELGVVGFFLFLSIIFVIYRLNSTIGRYTNCNDLISFGILSNQALLIYCVCGLFIGVAFYPWLYYLLGLAISLSHVASKYGVKNDGSSMVVDLKNDEIS